MRQSMCCKAVMVLVLAGLVCMTGGCASMEGSWKKAQQRNSSQSYSRFIREYPDSPYVGQAQKQIEGLAYQKAVTRNRMTAYQEFIKKYPAGPYTAQAREKLAELEKAAEDRAFEKARKKDTPYAYEQFLKSYPQSVRKEQVQKRIREKKMKIETDFYTSAVKTENYSQLLQYTSRYPEGRYLKSVQTLLEQFAWQALKADNFLSWDELNASYAEDSTSLTKAIESRNRGYRMGIYGYYLTGGVVVKTSDIIFTRPGAVAFNKLKVGVSNFSIATAKNRLLALFAREPERVLMIGNQIIVAAGSRIKLQYVRPSNAKSGLSAVAMAGKSMLQTSVSGGSDTDIGGINLFGKICRTGSVRVTETGLIFEKGAELMMRLPDRKKQ